MNQIYLKPKNILIIRLGSLGDIVLTTLMIRYLRHKWRNAHITMLTKECYHPLLDGIPHLDERLYYPQNKRSRRSFRHNLKQTEYDTVIDLQNNLVSRTITASVKPKSLFRYHRPRINRWIRIHFPLLRNLLSIPLPVALGYLSVLYPYGVFDRGLGTELIIPDQWKESLNTNLSNALLISPGARHQTKMWPVGKWIELLKLVYANGMTSQAILGSEVDTTLAQQIVDGVDHGVTILAGKTNIGELSAIIESGSVLITGDSGPMHIAEAVGTPIVSIFGATVPEFGFAPFRCQHELIQIKGLSCRPCHPHGSEKCPKGHFKCMENISVEQVFEAMKSVMSAKF